MRTYQACAGTYHRPVSVDGNPHCELPAATIALACPLAIPPDWEHDQEFDSEKTCRFQRTTAGEPERLTADPTVRRQGEQTTGHGYRPDLTDDELYALEGYVRCADPRYVVPMEEHLRGDKEAIAKACGTGFDPSVPDDQACERADALARENGLRATDDPADTSAPFVTYSFVNGRCVPDFDPCLAKPGGPTCIRTTCPAVAGFLGSMRHYSNGVEYESCVFDPDVTVDTKAVFQLDHRLDYRWRCPDRTKDAGKLVHHVTRNVLPPQLAELPECGGTREPPPVCGDDTFHKGKLLKDVNDECNYKCEPVNGEPAVILTNPDQVPATDCPKARPVCPDDSPLAGQVVPEGKTEAEFCWPEVCPENTLHAGELVSSVKNGDCVPLCPDHSDHPDVPVRDVGSCWDPPEVCPDGTDRAGQLVNDRPCNDPPEVCPEGTDRAGLPVNDLPCNDPPVVVPDRCATPPVLTAADVDALLGVSTVWGEQTFDRFAAFAARGPAWADGVAVVLGAPATLRVDSGWAVQGADGCTWVADEVRWTVARVDPRRDRALDRWWDDQSTLVHVIADEGGLPPAPATARWTRDACADGPCPGARLVPPQVPFVQRWPIASNVAVTLVPVADESDDKAPQRAQIAGGGGEQIWLYHYSAYTTIVTVP